MRLKMLIIALLTCNVMWASDVIVTKDSKKIDAKITEVTSSEVKYKKLNALDGPTFTLSTSEIQTIVYDNGDVSTFNQEGTKKGYQLYDENVTLGFKRINGKKVSSADYADYLKEHCTPAYNKFRKGQNLYVAGWTCLIAGVTLEICGGVISGISGATEALPFTLTGSLAVVAGVPLLITGAVNRGRSISVYETECNGKTAMELNFGFTKNGVGLALNF